MLEAQYQIKELTPGPKAPQTPRGDHLPASPASHVATETGGDIGRFHGDGLKEEPAIPEFTNPNVVNKQEFDDMK